MMNLNYKCSECSAVFRAPKKHGLDAYFRKCPRCKGVATPEMTVPKSQRPRRAPR